MDIVNRVAESGILTLDLAGYLPAPEQIAFFDLKPFLFREMILKEKDFRAALQAADWQPYAGKQVALGCTADAIVPVWAYMLVTTYLRPVAAGVFFGSAEELAHRLFSRNLDRLDPEAYRDKRVVIKGCGDVAIPEYAYVEISYRLLPFVKSLMYGEPCSTVPVYKSKPAPAN